MAVEIREVIIRAVINQNNEMTGKDARLGDTQNDRSAVVQACVQEVLRILKRSKER
jgi:hypothetical protein